MPRVPPLPAGGATDGATAPTNHTTTTIDPVTAAAIDQADAVADLAARIAARLRQAGCPPYATALALVELQRLTVQLQDHLDRLGGTDR